MSDLSARNKSLCFTKKHRAAQFLKSIQQLLVFILLISCTKTVDHRNIPDDFKGWCRFREGSYWIYLNEKTQKTDCTYVIKYTAGTYNHYDSDVLKYYYDWEKSQLTGCFLSWIDAEAEDLGNATMDIGPFRFSTRLLANPSYQKAWYAGQSNSGVVAVYFGKPRAEIV